MSRARAGRLAARSRHLGVRLVRKQVGIKKAHAICDSSMTSDLNTQMEDLRQDAREQAEVGMNDHAVGVTALRIEMEAVERQSVEAFAITEDARMQELATLRTESNGAFACAVDAHKSAEVMVTGHSAEIDALRMEMEDAERQRNKRLHAPRKRTSNRNSDGATVLRR